MGSTSSNLAPQYDINKLILCINSNALKPFKSNIKMVDVKHLDKLLLEAIDKGKKEFFDVVLNRIKSIKKSNPESYSNTDFYEQCSSAIINNTIPYYAIRLIEVNKDIVPNENKLLHIAIQFEREEIAHQLILNGSDISSSGIEETTPLEEAIRCNSLQLVCMLLFYGAYTSYLQNDLTYFMYSIISQSSHDIQRTLIEYETDFNLTYNGTSILFYAIRYKSPLILEIIERGGDINYCYGIHNVISLAMYCECDPGVFRLLWQQFDYNVWKMSYSKSVLLKLIQDYMSPPKWIQYLKIVMENETKLRLDLEHHNNSYFYKSDLLISMFYLRCLNIGIESETIECWILHLLSHGAYIFTKDVDIIYSALKAFTPYLEQLLYMDLQDCYDLQISHSVNNLMYFRYCPIPDIHNFLTNVTIFSDVLSDTLKLLKRFYAFTTTLQLQILAILDDEERSYNFVKHILESSVNFPSLLQLSRDATRRNICIHYDIKNSCKLHTIVRYLNIPRCTQDILLYSKCIYHFS